jgi:hypothetical protein
VAVRGRIPNGYDTVGYQIQPVLGRGHPRGGNVSHYEQHKEAYKARALVWAVKNPERRREIERKYREGSPRKVAYNNHKQNAKRRGTEFNMTFEEWNGWWGDDFDKRGTGADDLCMCRTNDEGPYELGNIYKATRSTNGAHGIAKRWRK